MAVVEAREELAAWIVIVPVPTLLSPAGNPALLRMALMRDPVSWTTNPADPSWYWLAMVVAEIAEV